nr:MAG TPA: hypothetical protein [Caudoviricetes sp.]
MSRFPQWRRYFQTHLKRYNCGAKVNTQRTTHVLLRSCLNPMQSV